MFRKFTPAIVALLSFPALLQAQDTLVVPAANTTTAGSSAFSLYATSPRSFQWLMDSSLLTPLINETITGVSYRGAASATTDWPATNITINNYDLYMGGAVPIPTAGAVFAANQSGTQTQVRSGSLVIAANSFVSGSSWGPVINFTTPYLYTGGHLSLLLRNDGYTGTTKSVNALPTTGTSYNVLYKATYDAGYASVGSSAGNFVILRFTTGNAPLPVSLLSFNCQVSGYDATLHWATASEQHAQQYVIERSHDGITFEALQTLPAKGYNGGGEQYTFTDINVFRANDMVFYRLKMVDNDGTYKYSNINKLSNGSVQASNLVLYPNPVKSMGNMSYQLPAEATVTCLVYDITGKLVYQDVVTGAKGKNSVLMDFSSLKSGHYVLRLQGTGIDDVYKFLKD